MKPLPTELTDALKLEQAPVPMSEASGAAQASAIVRLVSVLGPDFKRLMASLLLVGFKLVELTDAEKKQVQQQMIEVAREAKAQADTKKPNVLKLVRPPRIIRPH